MKMLVHTAAETRKRPRDKCAHPAGLKNQKIKVALDGDDDIDALLDVTDELD